MTLKYSDLERYVCLHFKKVSFESSICGLVVEVVRCGILGYGVLVLCFEFFDPRTSQIRVNIGM